ncbi:MAG: ATP-binding protein [Clostridia bacterium]|nr:ATP-binding protein [Clostridia bacterium]
MKKRVLDKVIGDLNRKTNQVKDRIATMRALAYQIPEISSAQQAYSKAKFDSIKTGDSVAVKVARDAYVNALSKHGYKESDFEYTPSCNRCNDTGFHNGKLCACVKKQYIIALAKECDILNRAPFSFKDCNTSGMDEVQGKALKKLYDYAEEYVAKYPAVTKNILVFTGATGTGKSCLASAIARKAVLERGKSALVLTAYEFNSTCLNTHLAPIEDKERVLHDTLTADFLVIDDLGTEPILKNVTLEYLQLVLDERTREGRTTVITTNLSEKQLKDRYGERIFSRLSDTRHALLRRIPGKDLRLK